MATNTVGIDKEVEVDARKICATIACTGSGAGRRT